MTELDEISMKYSLPDWFLRCNVTRVGEKIDTTRSIPLEAVGDDALNVERSLEEKALYDNGTFSELRDATAAALVCDQAGELLATHGSIVVRCPTKNAMPLIDSLLLHVAADLEATLVSVDLEDLNDLGWEFDDQDRRAMQANGTVSRGRDGPDRQNMFHEMGFYYFGAASKKRYGNDENWNRSMRAIEGLIDIDIPRLQQHLSRESKSTTDSGTPFAEGPPLLLYVRNYNEMADDRYPGERHFGKICPDATFNITINPESPTEVESETESAKGLLGDMNFRRLKRFLRYRIPHLLSPGLAEAVGVDRPFSDWTAQGFKGQYESLTASAWTADELQRAATRIAGRAFVESKLDFNGVHDVLLSTGLYKSVNETSESIEDAAPDESGAKQAVVEVIADSDAEKSIMGSDERSNEQSDEETPKEQRPAETWSEKLRRIERNANEFERDLISCIVNPDKLETTFDDVIIDEETKETIGYLVSLSNFRPEAASESLLKHIRVTGALLYGPPGTGKTHLSRAIAKASGSSMLAIDSATMQSKFVGETEKYIRAAFSLSASLFPCVLFIDEVDALFYRRSSADISWQRSALAQFLSEMDGLTHSDKAPFVVVATNRPQDLDEAFYRRLPHKIYFKLPDMESRIKILQIFLKKEDLDPLVDLKGLARCTDGYSGSDLRSLCAEAAMNWALEQLKKGSGEKRTNKLYMNASHFVKALQRIRPSVSPQLIDDFSEFAQRFNPETVGEPLLDAEVASKMGMASLEKMIGAGRKEGQTLLVLNSRKCTDDPTGGELSQALKGANTPNSKPRWVGSLSDVLEDWLLQPELKVGP
ncbi:hypothetical protein PENOC_095810 [Penicillium occitanis (nom. inval.)]|nr:hypothetical protein PENOC_095810 [Penicillium occitanis (nom. inval.)]